MPDPIQSLLDEHAELQEQLADPAVHAEQGRARKLGRRYAELNGVVEAHRRVQRLEEDLGAARELAAEEPEFAEEIPSLEDQLGEARE